MTSEKSDCSCCDQSRRVMFTRSLFTFSSIFLMLTVGVPHLPSGYSHIASVVESDGVPGMPSKPISRGPTVAPVPSQETLEQISRNDDSYFNPGEAIRNLLSLSSASHSNRFPGLKRVSQFHSNEGSEGSYGGASSGADLRAPFQHSWDYDEDGLMQDGEEIEKPTFVPFIGARALTNIPQFFEHLRENIEALKLSPQVTARRESDNSYDEGDSDDEESDLEEKRRSGGGGSTKPAARRMKTELLVDENLGTSSSNKPSDSWTLKQGWKPRAAGTVHYYVPSKSNFLDRQQNILRRANNYNPAWLYTNLGLGKKRR